MKEKQPFITIFTPTYNRAYIINKLYESLVKQKINDFEWLIIDDGSTDNTKQLVKKMSNENKIDIKYIYKQNKGKYKAINDAVDIAKGKLFMIVDSDDYLTEDAIVQIKKYYEQIKDKKNFIGVVGLRGNSKGNIYTGYFKEENKKNKYYNFEYIDADYIQYRYKYKISGDRAEVCLTEKLRKYKFPECNNEKYMGEAYIWNQIAEDGYKFRYFNKVIYITEYLEDGLTFNLKKILKDNKENVIITNNQIAEIKRIPLRIRIKACTKYYIMNFICKNSIKVSLKKSNNKKLSIFCIPIAIVLKNFYKKKYIEC